MNENKTYATVRLRRLQRLRPVHASAARNSDAERDRARPRHLRQKRLSRLRALSYEQAMSEPRVIRFATVPREAFAREAANPAFCRNCGDPAPTLADEDWNGAVPSGSWRPCPNPAPGRPMLDCGVGGHMYTDETPRID